MFFILVLTKILFCSHDSKAQYALAWQRSLGLGKGVNANLWLTSEFNSFQPNLYTKQDFDQMRALGFNHVRLPVSFNKWLDVVPGASLDSLLTYVDSAKNWCLQNQMKLIIDFHPSGDEDATILNPNHPQFHYFKTTIALIWKKVAQRYVNVSPDSLLYDIYNEPTHVNESQYSLFAKEVVDSIRAIDVQKTIILEGDLSYITAIGDTNVIGTFHYYNPSNFTHQGASWTPFPRNTIGIPFTYDSLAMPPLNPIDSLDPYTKYLYNNYQYFGSDNYIQNSLDWLISECRMYANIPLYCGEFGVSNMAPIESKIEWIETIRLELENRQVPWAVWSWKGPNTPASFQLFDCFMCTEVDSVVQTTLGYTQLCALGLGSCLVLTKQNQPEETDLPQENILFPNPGNRYISFKQDVLWTKIYDIYGREVFACQSPKKAFQEILIPENLKQGVYLVQFGSKEAYKTYQQRWIKK